jgi:hypothetical protein
MLSGIRSDEISCVSFEPFRTRLSAAAMRNAAVSSQQSAVARHFMQYIESNGLTNEDTK